MMDVPIFRAMPVQDIEIQKGGDGRTVVAYATPFDVQTEIMDHNGHYMEVVNAHAFDKTLRENFGSIQVLYNHGWTVHGTPSDKWSSPLGVPLEITPDGRGLRTVTRYDNTPHAEEVLEMIRSGSIRSQSFSGGSLVDKIVVRGQTDDGLPIIEHREMKLKEYGPTPFPKAHHGAEILAVRSASQIVDELRTLPDERMAEVLAQLTGTPPPEPPDPDTPVEEPPPEETHPSVVPSLLAANEQRRRRGA